jgi:hypothetical protein
VTPAEVPDKTKFNDLGRQTHLKPHVDAKGLSAAVANRSPPKRPPRKKTPARVGQAQGLSKQDGRREATDSSAAPQARRAGCQSLSRLFQADAAVSVYDGQQLAGVVTKHGSTYEAHDAQGRFLGAFQRQREAVAACPIAGAS